MDGLSAAASVDALLGLSIKIYKVSRDIIKAEEEKQQYRDTLYGLEDELQSLARLQQDSQGDLKKLYIENLFRVAQKGRPGIGKQQGALISMSLAMQDMHRELRDMHGWEKKLKRVMWTVDKEKFRAMLDEIQKWRSQVQFAMQQDQLVLALDSLKIGIDTNDRVQGIQRVTAETQGATQVIAQMTSGVDERTQRVESVGEDTNARMKSVQADTLALRVRKEKKDQTQLYQAVANWLSRLDSNARHSQIYDRCIDISQGLVDSPEFQAWKTKRPWVLFCWADAGAGKVYTRCSSDPQRELTSIDNAKFFGH